MTMLLEASLAQLDPEIAAVLYAERERQQAPLDMIASQNFVPVAVMQCHGSGVTKEYAQGYPGRRDYSGLKHVDVAQGAFALTATDPGSDANVAAGLDAGFVNSTRLSCGARADTCAIDATTEITLLGRGSNGTGSGPLRAPVTSEPDLRLREGRGR
jgi:hypothetical protein